jgi:DNA-binding beta-propeller fold protein YncE
MPLTYTGSVIHVDAEGLEKSQSINLGGYPQDLAIGEGAVWVSDQNSVTQIDPATRTRIREIEVGGGLGPITTGGGSVWVLNSVDETVIRIDPATSEAAQEMTVGESEVHQQQRNILRRYSFRDATFSELMDLLYWQDTLWIADGGRSVIHRFDSETGQKAGKPIKVGKGPAYLVVAEGDVWSVNFWAGTLSRIDSTSGKVEGRITACSRPLSAVAGPRWIWVSCDGDSSIVRIDPASMTRVGQPIPGLPSPWGIARTKDSLWVVGYRSKSLARIRLDEVEGPQ